ncbi:MAG: Rpp14/Pop5 family protein [Candidatus Undinarchaeales archaeon]|jgi:ribonuclease P/MRP protein subunit POP5|nr:Rpp14/Pop5 family protein [Candidatus Undinarchaeales archaeon]
MTKFRVKPTMKETWRYIVFDLISKTSVKEQDVVRAITGSILRMFGEFGASKTNVWLIEYDAKTKKGIVRCSHKAVQTVVASVTTITKIGDVEAAFVVKGVSGTIKKAKVKFI